MGAAGEHWDLACAARLKSVLVARGQLEGLSCERDLIVWSPSRDDKEIDDAVAKLYRPARERANKYLADKKTAAELAATPSAFQS